MEWNIYIETFLSWPLIGRTACILFLIVVICGVLFGRYLLRLLSVLPFLLSKVFRAIYLVIEFPINLLHKKYGGSFYNVANVAAQTGGKIDSKLLQWYGSWRHADRVGILKILLLYFCAVIFIGAIPMLAGSMDAPIARGGKAYLQCEEKLTGWMEELGWYTSSETLIQKTIFLPLDSLQILKNGKLVKLDSSLCMRNGRLYIPVRSVAEALGGTVSWDGKAGQVLVQLGQTEIRMSGNSSTICLNDREGELRNSPIDINAKMYVEADDFLGLFGYYVDWYEEENLLSISDAINVRAGVLTLQYVKERLGLDGQFSKLKIVVGNTIN